MTKEAIAAVIENASEVQDDTFKDCPVRPLGHKQGVYYFLSPSGELRELRPMDFSVNGLLSLFNGSDVWLKEHAPREDRKGNVTGFEANTAARLLMAECSAKGMFDLNMPVRGPGTWRTSTLDKNGVAQLVVHCGDVLYWSGENKVTPAGEVIDGAIYTAAPRVQRLAEKPSTDAEGQYLLDTLKCWKYARPEIDPQLILGFIGQGILGGAPDWRAHVMTNAEKGVGKSTLALTVGRAMGGSAHPPSNNFSEAGLRQAITSEARALILDEAEKEDGESRIMKVIEMLRHMSGGAGMRALRGSTGGKSQIFTVTGSAYLSGVLRVPLRPQDKSRITTIDLQPNEADAEAMTTLMERMDKVDALSGAYRRRMIDLWPLFQTNVKRYRAALIEAGLSSRNADQLATLLAGKETLLHDEPVTADQIQEDIVNSDKLINEANDDQGDGEGDQCLQFLMSSPADSWGGGTRKTIGQLITAAIKDRADEDIKALAAYGIRIETARDPAPHVCGLVIASSHAALNRIYNGTRWSGGAWSGALTYLGGERRKPQKYGGATCRGIAIPEAYWPVKSNGREHDTHDEQ